MIVISLIFRKIYIYFKHFMAVALNKADKDSFEVHFPQLERGLLSRTGGCVRKVVMLIKYLRDITGGTVNKLWSHLLKVILFYHHLLSLIKLNSIISIYSYLISLYHLDVCNEPCLEKSDLTRWRLLEQQKSDKMFHWLYDKFMDWSSERNYQRHFLSRGTYVFQSR